MAVQQDDSAGDEGQVSRATLPRSRSLEARDRRRARAQQAPRRMARSFIQLPKQMNPLVTLGVVLLVICLALSIATPLRNYFEQRATLAQLNADIAQQQQRKGELTKELNKYQNEDYIKEQARTRLGLIEPGESAFRIMSPKIHSGTPGSDSIGQHEEPTESKPWYQELWDSIAIPEKAPETSPAPDHELPVPTVPKADQGQPAQ